MSLLTNLSPKSIIHFSGIGGIGMSGIAEILNNLGYKIKGSDLSSNSNTERLAGLGIKIFKGHSPENVKGISLLVTSSAITKTNPEVVYCTEHNIKIVLRTAMLAELMSTKTSIAISGTHGKTTTTSLVAAVFEKAKLSPTVINGGIINNKGTNAYLGDGDYLIAEADESDATFINIPSTIAVITNIDPEHLDFYGTYDKLKKAFETFIQDLPVYGFGVLCIDNLEVKKIANKVTDRKIITYSLHSKEADIYADNIEQTDTGHKFDIHISSKLNTKHKTIENIHLPIPGIHNVQNSLAALAIAIELGFSKKVIVDAFSDFEGVKRRFTKVATYKGVSIIDDYAHHPTEVMATLATATQVAKRKNGRIITIFQPHRYSRLQSLMNEFSTSFKGSDLLYIADVYGSSEEPIPGVDKEALLAAIKKNQPSTKVELLTSKDQIPGIIENVCKENDLLLFLGAGDISKWANELPQKLKQK